MSSRGFASLLAWETHSGVPFGVRPSGMALWPAVPGFGQLGSWNPIYIYVCVCVYIYTDPIVGHAAVTNAHGVQKRIADNLKTVWSCRPSGRRLPYQGAVSAGMSEETGRCAEGVSLSSRVT